MSLIRNSSYNFVGTIIPIIVAIVTIPAYIHIIGSAKFGLLSIAFLILGYFGIFDLGMGRAVAYRIAGSPDANRTSHKQIVGTAVLCNLALGLVGGVILAGITYFYFGYLLDADNILREQMLKAIPALVLSVPITALTGVLSGSLEGRGKFASVNFATTFASVLFHVLPLGIAYTGIDQLHWLITAACVTRVVGVAILLSLCLKEFGLFSRIDPREARQLFQFGGWVAVSSIVGPMMIITDRFVIGALIGPTAVASYTIPFEIAARTAAIPQAIGRALFPQISGQNDPVSIRQLGFQTSLILAAITSPLTVIGIFLMKPFLDLWLGNYASESVLIGQTILVAFWVNAMSYVPLTVIVGSGRPKTVAVTHCIELIPYLAVLYFLTKIFGIEGAAVAFLLRCVADYLVLGWMSGLIGRIALPHSIFALLIASAFASAIYIAPELLDSIMLALLFMFLTSLVILCFGRKQISALCLELIGRSKFGKS